MTPEWVWTIGTSLLTGAVGGAVVALIGGAVESRRIHVRWRRERRAEAYLDFYKLQLVVETAIATGTNGSDYSRREIADRTAAIVFIGPDRVGLAAGEYDKMLKQWATALEATRADPEDDKLATVAAIAENALGEARLRFVAVARGAADLD
jgi:hypothetical protein